MLGNIAFSIRFGSTCDIVDKETTISNSLFSSCFRLITFSYAEL